MGHTRANVLRAIHIGQTTTQLGRSLNISAASASRHTAVLREAGLITSHRQLSAVLRTLTPLGTALLEQDRTTVL
jgi:DNA-binding MarR family transcriptional regulator